MLKTLLKDVVDVDPETDEAKRITTKVGKPAGKFNVFTDVSLQCDIRICRMIMDINIY